MALTSLDETDLILPLFDGINEDRLFATFLERVRRRTGADYVGLVIRRSRDADRFATEFFAGTDLRARARAIGIEELYMLEGVHHAVLRPDRVYSLAEFVDHDPEYRARRQSGVEQLGIVDERVIRVYDEFGMSAWMILAKSRACSASDSALLTALSRYVVIALRNMLVLERQRIEAAIAAEGLSRTGMGWMLFDTDATLLLSDPATEQELETRTGIVARMGERLQVPAIGAERELIAAASRLAGDPCSDPATVMLCEEPRVDALLLPAGNLVKTAVTVPTMLALIRHERPPSASRIAGVTHLFDLPPREAELAIALCDGLSIASAAEAMGLTIETARNYSKRVYAKLDVAGQAQLVRLIHQSSAILA